MLHIVWPYSEKTCTHKHLWTGAGWPLVTCEGSWIVGFLGWTSSLGTLITLPLHLFQAIIIVYGIGYQGQCCPGVSVRPTPNHFLKKGLTYKGILPVPRAEMSLTEVHVLFRSPPKRDRMLFWGKLLIALTTSSSSPCPSKGCLGY